MFTLNKERLYAPYNLKTGAVGYAVSSNKSEAVSKFCELMGTGVTWKNLRKEGWVTLVVDIDASEDQLSSKQLKQLDKLY